MRKRRSYDPERDVERDASLERVGRILGLILAFIVWGWLLAEME